MSIPQKIFIIYKLSYLYLYVHFFCLPILDNSVARKMALFWGKKPVKKIFDAFFQNKITIFLFTSSTRFTNFCWKYHFFKKKNASKNYKVGFWEVLWRNAAKFFSGFFVTKKCPYFGPRKISEKGFFWLTKKKRTYTSQFIFIFAKLVY